MAVSLANYPQTGGETSNLSEYDDENVSLAKFLPSHTKQALPRFETVVPQQNGSVANKNIHSFNYKRNSFPRTVPRNSSSTKRHSMYGDLPSQQINRSSSNKSSAKMRRRAASFGENSVVRNNNSNKYNNNINNNSLTTTETKKKYTTPLIIHIPSKVDKVGSQRSSPRSPKPSPKPSPKEKSSPKGTKSSTTQHHHIEQKQEILDNNKIEVSNNNQNQNEKGSNKSSLDKKHSRTFSDDYSQNKNNRIENNNIENPQLISNNNSNLSSQNSKTPFYRHNVTLNGSAGGSSTDLRKSLYKEPSFRKRLRKVFSLSNIKQDNNNSNSTNSTSSSASSTKFSSLRDKKSNFSDDNDDNISVSSSNSDSHNKSSRRRSIIDLFSSKNEKKRNKQERHQNQQQQYLKQQQSPLSPSDQQGKQLNDNKKNSSLDEMRGNNNNKEKQGNGNGNERVDDDPALIPSRLSSLQSLNDDGSPNQFKHQNSTSPLYNQFRINKSEDLDKEQKNNSSSRPLSLPVSAKNKETSTTPRRLSVPAPLSVDSSNNNQAKPPFVNLGANATRSVPSLVLLRDTDIPPAPSTPTSIKKLQFSSTILIHETWTREDYDRRGDQSTCNKLTPILAQKLNKN